MLTSDIKKELFKNPDVTSVSWGYRTKHGQQTNEACIVVGVKTKLGPKWIPYGRMIPTSIQSITTDVQERDIKTQGFVARMRPCPPGFSIGHTTITAGTLGAYVRVSGIDDWAILSNNHVLAASNQGKINDKIIQPGKADGGFSGSDLFAWLRKFAVIKWDSDGENGENGGCNIFARVWNRFQKIQSIEQPYPNLIDAAIAVPVNQGYVKFQYPDGSETPHKSTSLNLGDPVKKMGRTTELTFGTVVGINTMVKVQYGSGIATFDDQLEIRGDEGRFSAGGDSGSAILSNGKLGGLLFAGGSGITIANRIYHIENLLGVELDN